MRVKILLSVVTLLVLTVVILAVGNNTKRSLQIQQKQLADLEKAPDRGTINWHVRVAKAKGEKRIALPVQRPEYASGVKDLDEALKYTGLILAKPIEMKSVFVADAGINTWYKFKILDYLSTKPLPQCSCGSDLVIPEGLSNLGQDEILIPYGGGEVEVDGIKLVYEAPEWPPFEIAKEYLLLLQTDSSGKIGLIMMGPSGVFTVDDHDRLKPINNKDHPVTTEINGRFSSSVQLIKNHLHNRSK